MANEQQSQSQQAATSTTQAQTSQQQAPAQGSQTTEAGGDTLEKVYKEFNVDQMAANFRPQPAAQPAQAQAQQPVQHAAAAAPNGSVENVPDPVLQPDQFKAWARDQVNTLRQGHQQVQGMLSSMQAAQLRQQEESEIKAAVSAVKQAGFEAEDDFVEIALGQKARNDPRFLMVYNNRRTNPQAWQRALGAFANEAKGKYAFKTDSTLAENVRAAKASTQTTQAQNNAQEPTGDEKRFAGKVGKDFDAEWNRYVHQGV